jgi:hypothetical protein
MVLKCKRYKEKRKQKIIKERRKKGERVSDRAAQPDPISAAHQSNPNRYFFPHPFPL